MVFAMITLVVIFVVAVMMDGVLGSFPFITIIGTIFCVYFYCCRRKSKRKYTIQYCCRGTSR